MNLVERICEAQRMVGALSTIGHKDWDAALRDVLQDPDTHTLATCIRVISDLYGHNPEVLAVVVYIAATLHERDRAEAST